MTSPSDSERMTYYQAENSAFYARSEIGITVGEVANTSKDFGSA
jgi:hypothetical protein